MRLTKEECRQLKGWYKKLQAREREIFEAVASELGYDQPALPGEVQGSHSLLSGLPRSQYAIDDG